MKSEKARKRAASMHHNPWGHKQYGFYAKAYRQLMYIRKNWR